MREAVAALALVLALATPAFAQSRMTFINGNELHEMCQVDRARCEGFIWGVADALEATAWPSPRSCRPKSVIADQVVDLAIQALAGKPAERHRPAFDLIADEVVGLWPC
ncbi:hypothetical protein IC608_09080 [Devosia sp. PTR5]|uniref:Rap1a immunity protein domain-containing protein n=1 Tax=Devosia oryzisoli TaxID=2774138 RepID=A0A927ITB2_9HYPH|nr:hypothetical protein [Devosia oryzisoli]